MAGGLNVIHGTAIALDGLAALICGPSGSGKSDLALRCLMQGPNSLVKGDVRLVADDYAVVQVVNGTVILSAPETIRDQLEVRGHGIVTVPALDNAELALIVELVSADQVERLPDPRPRREIAGISLPLLQISGFEASAACKVLLELAQFGCANGKKDDLVL